MHDADQPWSIGKGRGVEDRPCNPAPHEADRGDLGIGEGSPELILIFTGDLERQINPRVASQSHVLKR